MTLCLVEQRRHSACDLRDEFDQTVLAREIGIDGFERFAFRHTLLELATAVKPRLLEFMFETNPEEDVVIYLDPDIAVLGPFSEAESALRQASILVTPHHLQDVRDPHGIVDTVFPVLRCGVFNLGFLGLRRGTSTLDFLRWWRHKVESGPLRRLQ